MASVRDPWPAPRAAGPVDAVLGVPGSKSVTNRALVLAALADGPSTISGPLRARDTLLMAGALRALGVRIADDGTDWHVEPGRLRGPAAVDVGLAGTVLRFVPPVAVLADGPVDFDGDPRSRERPVGQLLAALRVLGAAVNDAGRGALPFTVRGSGALPGGTATIDASASSQLVSGLLLAAPRFDQGLTLRHAGSRVPSGLHIEMTVRMLRDAGAEVDAVSERDRREWTVKPGGLTARDVAVAPDLSTAAPFAAAALVTGGRVRVLGWPRRAYQPGDLLPDLLTSMGATCALDDGGLTVTGGASIEGIDVDLGDASELAPVLAAVAALARTPSTLRGIGHTRTHETDRLAALATELGRLGGDVTETADGLRIVPRPLRGGVFRTYHDHRLAMAAAVLGLAVDGVGIENVATTGKTVPDFPARWLAMLGRPGTAPDRAPAPDDAGRGTGTPDSHAGAGTAPDRAPAPDDAGRGTGTGPGR